MTSWRYGALDRAAPHAPRCRDRAGAARFARRDWSSTASTSSGSISTGVRESRCTPERPDDRLPGGLPVEMVETQVVREQARDPRLERVERGEHVLAQRAGEVGAEPARSTASAKSTANVSAVRLAVVVEEVLLDLVEDHVELAAEAARSSSSVSASGASPASRSPQAPRPPRAPPIGHRVARASRRRRRRRARRLTAARSAREARSWWTTPARSTELLPTPLAP